MVADMKQVAFPTLKNQQAKYNKKVIINNNWNYK